MFTLKIISGGVVAHRWTFEHDQLKRMQRALRCVIDTSGQGAAWVLRPDSPDQIYLVARWDRCGTKYLAQR